MPFTDKILVCADCGAEFTFTAGEQEFHQSKGFSNEPRRCPNCRRARRTDGGGGGGAGAGAGGGFRSGPSRPMFPAVCASCGKETQVPFEPRGDRPVYCSDCFQPQPRSFGGSGGGGYGGGGGGGGFGGGGRGGGGFGGGGGRGGDRRGGGGGGGRDRRW